jgi:acyl-[acyl-carrier-protein]-phospholipid O-acyltransferase/long-chain-fatty-acid--[acyl-carrier-protein] ligase
MKPLQRRRRFDSFLFAPAQASFSENVIKLTLIARPLWRLPATQQGRLISLMFLSLVAPVRARLGYELLEGSGMTEASPDFGLKLAMPHRGAGADTILRMSPERGAGRLLLDIATRRLKSARFGSNLVARYLCEHVQAKFRRGCYITGDIGRINEEEFLILAEHVSGFSKIGDMVSHAAVEQAITSSPAADAAQDYTIGVFSLENGEELVLLTTRPMNREERDRALATHGMPNLWIPPTVVQVSQLPMVASGRLNFAAGLKLAEGASTAP